MDIYTGHFSYLVFEYQEFNNNKRTKWTWWPSLICYAVLGKLRAFKVAFVRRCCIVNSFLYFFSEIEKEIYSESKAYSFLIRATNLKWPSTSTKVQNNRIWYHLKRDPRGSGIIRALSRPHFALRPSFYIQFLELYPPGRCSIGPAQAHSHKGALGLSLNGNRFLPLPPISLVEYFQIFDYFPPDFP